MSWYPLDLVQCIEVNIRALVTVFEGGAGNISSVSRYVYGILQRLPLPVRIWR
jgi:hypothetical protein